MNRDERRDRASEYPPVWKSSWGGPLDGSSEGTWFGVNREGVVAGILNLYETRAGAHASHGTSRGTIIPKLLQLGSLERIETFLEKQFDGREFNGFRLIVADRQRTSIAIWNPSSGFSIKGNHDNWYLISSSSWNQEEVLAWRRAKFETWIEDGQRFEHNIPSIHLLRPAQKESWAPLMSREYSATRSITQARVCHDSVRVRWVPVSDGSVLYESEQTLEPSL